MDNEKAKQTVSFCSACMTTGKTIGLGGALVVLLGLCPTACAESDGGGGDWKYNGKTLDEVFYGFPKDEGEVYYNVGVCKVLQGSKKGNLVGARFLDRVIWVETSRRYEDGEFLDKGYYIRRGAMEYKPAIGAEITVARYVQMSEKNLHSKWKAALAATGKALGAGTRAGETKMLNLPGGATMEMVWCPPGTFMMGSDNGDPDETLHRVTLKKGFWLAKTEVTQKQWKSVMGGKPLSYQEDDSLPVRQMSWFGCDAFCKRAGLELPTEAQWEYACRAGSTGKYAGTGNLDEMGWYGDNSGFNAHPVGTKQPNVWGLYDMHGNVLEWCADWYGDYPAVPVTDPKGASSGWSRVLRGGGWGYDADYCRSAYRDYAIPAVSRDGQGFRPARALSK